MTQFHEEVEKKELFRQKESDKSAAMFAAKGTAGRNPTRLAQICSTFDYVMNLLGWQKKSVAELSRILTEYQASIDAKYHNDFKEVLIAEEIERRHAEQKGISILSQ